MPDLQFDFQPLKYIPAPAARNLAVRVTPAAERALHQEHPWVFEQSITSQSHAGSAGDLAVIFDSKRRFLAVGLYDPASIIRVRILQHNQPAEINQAFFASKLAQAADLRAPLANAAGNRLTTGYRLIHGENDSLPGLIIDRYASTLVIKLYTPAWIPHLKAFCAALAEVVPEERVVLRLSRTLQDQPELLFGLQDGMILAGEPLDGPVLFQENGLTFEAEPVHGQKTGFFLDQRENRARVERLSDGKDVLNVFAYTGGFSIYAARGGARHVTSVDLSAPACDAALRNMAHNIQYPAVKAACHETIAADAFQVLETMGARSRQFDLVIIDPPMFAQNQSQIAGALAAYRKLTRLGLQILAPSGILVQASCSSRVSADQFFKAIHQAAQETGRRLTEIERTFHALDHPITYPEGAYLKCLFARANP